MPPRGVVALIVVTLGSGGTMYLVHRNQQLERKVCAHTARARPIFFPASADVYSVRPQAMREAVLRDIEKLGR